MADHAQHQGTSPLHRARAEAVVSRPWLRRIAFAAALLPATALAQPAPPAEPAPSVPAPATPAPQTPARPAPPQAAPARPAVETPAVVLDGSVAETLLGKPVKGGNGDDMGRVVDVMVDRAGTIRAAIIDFGGFLGVGSRKIAVDWRVLHFPASGAMESIGADLSRDQLRTAPVYKPGEPVVIVGRADPAPTPPPAAVVPAPTPAAPTTPPAAAPATKP